MGSGEGVGFAMRWVARLGSAAVIVLVVLFLIGEPFNPSRTELLGLLFFPLGICAGMIVAWWKEALGGSITIGSLLAFYGVHFATSGRFPAGWAFLAFATPGFFFLLSWLVRRRRPRTVTV